MTYVYESRLISCIYEVEKTNLLRETETALSTLFKQLIFIQSHEILMDIM